MRDVSIRTLTENFTYFSRFQIEDVLALADWSLPVARFLLQDALAYGGPTCTPRHTVTAEKLAEARTHCGM